MGHADDCRIDDIDPVNLLTVDTYKNQEEIFCEAFELFGDRIVIVHAKDFILENNELKPVAVGKGLLNYDVVLKLIKKKKPFINILMEETKEPFIDESFAFLKESYQNA